MLCEKSLPLVGAISVQNGKICKSCASRIPKVMLETSENWADYTLQTAIDYEDEIYDKFESGNDSFTKFSNSTSAIFFALSFISFSLVII